MRSKTSVTFIVSMILICCSAALVLPWIMGIVFEKNYNDLIAFYNLQDNLSVKIIAYHRHWFHSQITLDVEMKNALWQKLSGKFPNQETKNLHFTVNQSVTHGPVTRNTQTKDWQFSIAKINSDIYPALNDDVFIVSSDASEPLLKITDTLAFNQTYSRHIASGGFKIIPTPSLPFHLLVNAIQSDMVINPKRRTLQGHLDIENIDVESTETTRRQLLFSKLHFNFNEKQRANVLWLGEQTIAVGAMEIKDPTVSFLAFNNIKEISNTQLQNNKFNTEKVFTLEKIICATQTFGPLTIAVSVKNINGNNFSNLVSALKKHVSLGNSYQKFMAEKIPSLLPKLIDADTHLNINQVSLASSTGELFDVKADLAWSKKPSTFLEMILASQFDAKITFSRRLLGKWHLPESMPASSHPHLSTLPSASLAHASNNQFLLKLQSYLAYLIQLGVINETHDNYSAHVTLNRGVVKINNKKFPSDK